MTTRTHAKVLSYHRSQHTNTLVCFIGRIPILSPNRQCQSTEGKVQHRTRMFKMFVSGFVQSSVECWHQVITRWTARLCCPLSLSTSNPAAAFLIFVPVQVEKLLPFYRRCFPVTESHLEQRCSLYGFCVKSKSPRPGHCSEMSAILKGVLEMS